VVKVPGDEEGLIQVVLDVHPHVLVRRHVQERARELVVNRDHLKKMNRVFHIVFSEFCIYSLQTHEATIFCCRKNM
jgi:hypothetical protein